MKLKTILTDRQLEIFMLTVQGYSEPEIARKLSVSVATISKVLRKVYSRLGAKNAINALREALLNNLLSVEDLKGKDLEKSKYMRKEGTIGMTNRELFHKSIEWDCSHMRELSKKELIDEVVSNSLVFHMLADFMDMCDVHDITQVPQRITPDVLNEWFDEEVHNDQRDTTRKEGSHE